MNWTPVSIANLALASIGSSPIQTFDDATPAGSLVNLMYPYVVGDLFAGYPWAFARDVRALDQLNVTTLSDGQTPAGWRYAFALPADLIGPPDKILANSRQPDTPTRDFEIQNTTVYSSYSSLWAVGVFAVDEAAWPPYFVSAAVAVLAAELYPLITGNGGRIKELQMTAWGLPEDNRIGGKVGAARRADARMNPSRILASNPLIDVRVGQTDVWSSGPGGA